MVRNRLATVQTHGGAPGRSPGCPRPGHRLSDARRVAGESGSRLTARRTASARRSWPPARPPADPLLRSPATHRLQRAPTTPMHNMDRRPITAAELLTDTSAGCIVPALAPAVEQPGAESASRVGSAPGHTSIEVGRPRKNLRLGSTLCWRDLGGVGAKLRQGDVQGFASAAPRLFLGRSGGSVGVHTPKAAR